MANAARLIGLLTLGWVYFAATDLRWLLHLHKVHLLLTHKPFAFDYNLYFGASIANVAVSVIAAGALILFPSSLLGALTPAAGRARSLRAGWRTAGVAFGLMLLVLSLHSVFATALWTIYSAGQNPGWGMELCTPALAAAAGMFLCRRLLTRAGAAI